MIEDANQRLRHSETHANANTRMSLQRCWFTPVQREVATKVHGYDEVDFTSVNPYSEACQAQGTGALGSSPLGRKVSELSRFNYKRLAHVGELS